MLTEILPRLSVIILNVQIIRSIVSNLQEDVNLVGLPLPPTNMYLLFSSRWYNWNCTQSYLQHRNRLWFSNSIASSLTLPSTKAKQKRNPYVLLKGLWVFLCVPHRNKQRHLKRNCCWHLMKPSLYKCVHTCLIPPSRKNVGLTGPKRFKYNTVTSVACYTTQVVERKLIQSNKTTW